MDTAGNIYISDITGNAIGVIGPDRAYRILHQDDELLSWPDAFAFGPDGSVYVAVNQLHRGPVLNAGVDASRKPYLILRFPGLAPGIVGR
jgi:sugar lactone lactonase YvrE